MADSKAATVTGRARTAPTTALPLPSTSPVAKTHGQNPGSLRASRDSRPTSTGAVNANHSAGFVDRATIRKRPRGTAKFTCFQWSFATKAASNGATSEPLAVRSIREVEGGRNVPQTRICRNGDSVSSGVLTNSPVAATPDGVHVPYAGNPQRFPNAGAAPRWNAGSGGPASAARASGGRIESGSTRRSAGSAAISVAAKMSPVVASNAERRVEASPAISARRRSAVIGESAAGPVSTGAPSSRGLNRALPTRMVQSTTATKRCVRRVWSSAGHAARHAPLMMSPVASTVATAGVVTAGTAASAASNASDQTARSASAGGGAAGRACSQRTMQMIAGAQTIGTHTACANCEDARARSAGKNDAAGPVAPERLAINQRPAARSAPLLAKVARRGRQA